MKVSRRQFVQLGGAAAASAAAPGWLAGDVVPRPPLAWAARTAAQMPEPDFATLLLNRAAFGPRPGDVERVRQMGVSAWIDEQLDFESIDDSAVEERLLANLPTLSATAAQLLNYGDNQNIAVEELRLATLYRMAFSPRLLHEVMVEFWTDHFSIYHDTDQCRYLKTIDDRDVIRKHALGKFKDLLTASAMSPAMLNFLNNDVSTKERPNENYAREIMELHTLGAAVDGYPYTEEDVKNVARCFTGWGWDQRPTSQLRGEFRFDADRHDEAAKTVLEKFVPGAGEMSDGHMVIQILTEDHKETPKFLARKLVRRFVTDDPDSQTPGLVTQVADAYTRQKGDIREMVRTILYSREFKDSFATYGGRLSRPMDLVARSLRALDVPPERFELRVNSSTNRNMRGALAAMGQTPFYWPTPDGYPDVKEAWAASAVMLTRWNLGLAAVGVGGKFGGELVPGFRAETPASLSTAGEALDYWIDRLLHREMLAEDRAILLDYLTGGGDDSTPLSTPVSGVLVTTVGARLPELAALILDSPYFQWR